MPDHESASVLHQPSLGLCYLTLYCREGLPCDSFCAELYCGTGHPHSNMTVSILALVYSYDVSQSLLNS